MSTAASAHAPVCTRRTAHGAERWLLRSGILFAVAQLAVLVYFSAAVASRWPPLGAPTADRVAHYVEHWQQIRIANALLPLPTPLFILFLGGFFSVLRRGEGRRGGLAAAAFAGGAAAAMVWPIGMLLGAIAMDIGRQGGDPVTMQVLEGIAPLTLALSAMPRAVMLGAASVLVLQSGCAARWVGWIGLALTPLTLAGTATLLVPQAFPLLGLGMLLFVVWIAAFSATALRRVQRRRQPLNAGFTSEAFTGGR